MRIIAHRGFSENYPENTLLAFEKAIESGVDGIETDIRLSQDEKAIVFHDESLSRIAHLDKAPEALTLAELKRLDVGEGEKIPSLDELIGLTNARTTLILEIKYNPATYKRLCQIVHESIHDKLSWIEVSCFEDAVLQELHRLNKDITLHKLIEEESILKEEAFHRRYDYIDCFDIDVRLAPIALEVGVIGHFKVILWTVENEDIHHAIEEGLYGIMTNNPQRLKEKYA